MASLLAVATIFVGLWTLNIYILQSEKGGLDKTTYVGTGAKNAGGAYTQGGPYLRDSTVHVLLRGPESNSQ